MFEVITTAVYETIPLLLVGMALYRLGFFTGNWNRRRMRLWGWVAVAASAAGTAALGGWAMMRDFPFWFTQFIYHGPVIILRVTMALGMMGLLVLATPKGPPGWLGARVIAAGRMAFSNYIAMSAVMAVLFQGWAIGLFGELHRPTLLLPVLGGWALMLGWSRPWLAHFRYGPLEWLWRCLVYGQWFAIRRKQA